MKITALVENHTELNVKAIHGLSLYIETKNHKILFDLGPNDTIFKNAEILGISLKDVDTVIISHGHMDHGGALKKFLQINNTAKIYVQRKAFEPHYSKFLFFKVGVGINSELSTNSQIVLLDGDMVIDSELQLFISDRIDQCYSCENDSLLSKDGKDDFKHEQNLIITEDKTALIMGCGHAGAVNILEKAAKFNPTICVGGYHLFNPLTKATVPTSLLNEIVENLKKYPNIQFYTCHCTGERAFGYLSSKMPNMHYLSCGKSVSDFTK